MTEMSHFPSDYRALVVGSTGGIGAALTRALCEDTRCAAVYAASRRGTGPDPGPGHDKAHALTLDLTDETSIEDAVATAREGGPLHLVIAATGFLHAEDISPEKTWRHLDGDALMTAYRINAIGPALLAKHALKAMALDERSVFAALSARVGSISDNRLGGWHAYRASKAALNQILKTLSIELARKSDTAVIAGLHPGTVDTGLSEPFQGNVPDEKLFTPAYSAGCLLSVIDGLDPGQSGRVFDWAGEEVLP